MARSRSNQQQNEQQESSQQSFQAVDGSSGVAFSEGVMSVNGLPQRPVKVEHWESTNGLTTYTAIEWEDPTNGERRTSCNCPGWTMKRKDKPRSCCHTKDMEGEKPCSRKKIESLAIASVAQAVAEIPDMQDGRMLRGIMLD